MTDFNQELYDHWIDAMKVRERHAGAFYEMWGRCRVHNINEAARNTDRLAAYKCKRAAYDQMMFAIESALEEMDYQRV